MKAVRCVAAVLFLLSPVLHAAELLVSSAHQADGTVVPYVLNQQTPNPRYVIILFPGGSGVVDPHMDGDQLVYSAKGNFLLRARALIVDDEFATVTTNTSNSTERIQALIDDLHARFSGARIYLMSTSRGTLASIDLAVYLSGRIAGEIHTSSMSNIAFFDPRSLANRQLLVHHKDDGCRATPFYAAERAHEHYAIELIVMQGGESRGNPCQPYAYHGYNGIEAQTVAAIKAWIKRGP
jgi:hypothetical protein